MLRLLTPLGPVDVQPEAVEVPDDRMRRGDLLISALRPILEEPTFIICDANEVSFYSAFFDPAGEVSCFGVVSLVGETVRLHAVEEPPEPVMSGMIPVHATTVTADVDEDGELVFRALTVRLPDDPVSVVICNSTLAFHMLAASIDLPESCDGPFPPDAHWVMFEPNGPKGDRQPVLVVPAGSGAYRVVVP